MSRTPQYDRERIVRLIASGVPSSQVAKRMGCSRQTVNRVMRDKRKEASDGSRG